MGKALFIAEKPSVAREFAKALGYTVSNKDGYMESGEAVITWCVGHLVSMSYPEVYDKSLKRWSFDTLPFIPSEYRYEVIDSVKKQFGIVKGLLQRPDVDTIYVCTDSGREGEYIYRLVESMADVSGKNRRRVWIDSQTEEEIKRGVREAKDLSAYDNLASAAYLRAKEDYLMGINFSRALTLKYGDSIKQYLGKDRAVIAAGRVMTCVLGIVVKREREIRNFVKTPFFKVPGEFAKGGLRLPGEWKVCEKSRYNGYPGLYKDNGFLKKEDAEQLISYLEEEPKAPAVVMSVEKKKETKNPPLLYNLAELQNDCSKYFKISPDETLKIAQELYEKKLTTYPRTDARVLSTAVAKVIAGNIKGLKNYAPVAQIAEDILLNERYRSTVKSRYVNDKQITDHYAIIPTGQGLGALGSLSQTASKVYELIARRFLSIFLDSAVYQKLSLTIGIREEIFVSNFKVPVREGYMAVALPEFLRKKGDRSAGENNTGENSEPEEDSFDESMLEGIGRLKKGEIFDAFALSVKEGETTPPKRYNSGSLILTMENAGQFIEDEELRSQIKGSGIGTSATRAEILKKLFNISYLQLNKKTQIIKPTQMGEMIYEVVRGSISQLLDPSLTASWEKGLSGVAEGSITSEEYMEKLSGFVARRTLFVRGLNNQGELYRSFRNLDSYYR